MVYKIKRPVTDYYIPLSDKIEKALDTEWKGEHGKCKGWREAPTDIPTRKGIRKIAKRHHDVQVQRKNKGMLNVPITTPKETLFDKWKKHLDSLDRNHKGFEVFDSNSGEESVKDLTKILNGGRQALDEKINELHDYNIETEYEMFKSSFDRFLEDEGVEQDSIEDHDTFRFEFEEHINWNIEKLFDYDVLLKDGSNTFSIESEDEHDPQREAFKKEALKYLSERQFQEIIRNSYGGTGFFGIIINAQDIITAIREGEKTVNDIRLIVGVHEMMGGSGYFIETRAEYKVSLDKAELDEGSYSLGDIFGHVDWKWR